MDRTCGRDKFMNIEEKARLNLTQERQAEGMLEENVLTRTEELLGEGEAETAKARVLLTENRQEDEKLQDKILERSIEAMQ
ncbi:hypothetical protein MiAbB_00823 [Microcystis aeruginosa NIES-4285]|uniref:Uncharacterized protein n=13 Tax=Microcystis TaxID=1125 RepID=A0A402D9N9_MICAE|nr:hypothetical protein MiAbB_00823 [Microcystis aeruginosa NIES-4285]